jgi:hypothetical protein
MASANDNRSDSPTSSPARTKKRRFDEREPGEIILGGGTISGGGDTTSTITVAEPPVHNESVELMRDALATLGIIAPSNTPIDFLLQLYKANKHQPKHTTNQTNTNVVNNTTMPSLDTALSATTEPGASIRDLKDSGRHVNDNIAAVEFVKSLSKLSSSLPFSTPTTAADLSVVNSHKSPHEWEATYVHQKWKTDILAGKLVNLAVLLLPWDSAHVESTDGSTIYVKDSKEDKRLKKSLTISEFLTAWGKFCSVFCSAYPNRRCEMIAYQNLLIDMDTRFGACFYEYVSSHDLPLLIVLICAFISLECIRNVLLLALLYGNAVLFGLCCSYHRAFAAKAAALIERNIVIDWSVVDTKLYNNIFGGRAARRCDCCGSTEHVTSFCDQTNDKGSKDFRFSRELPNISDASIHRDPSRSRPIVRNLHSDGRGRPRVFTADQIEICNNWNLYTCTSPVCRRAHVCLSCKGSHTSKLCGLSSTANLIQQASTNASTAIAKH